jgi:transcriptional regulator with XRE-family HTH domain
MGNPRPRSQLLPQKLLLIREHLHLTQTEIKKSLDLSQAARVSEYEKGKRKPPLEVVLGYSKLARVPMESLVEDEISIDEVRHQLGTFDISQRLPGKDQELPGNFDLQSL